MEGQIKKDNNSDTNATNMATKADILYGTSGYQVGSDLITLGS